MRSCLYKARWLDQYRGGSEKPPAGAYSAHSGLRNQKCAVFQQHLLSISEKNPDTLLNQAYALAYDEAAQRTMLAAQRKHIPRNAAEQIYRHIVSETMLKERAV